MDQDVAMTGKGNFPSTRWTCIRRICSDDIVDARAAMEEVCRAYWRPLHGFALSMNKSHHDAEDCVQGFLMRVSSEDFFESVSPHKGKLRSFLLVSFKRYIADVWRKESSQKRGGGNPDLQLDEEVAADCAPEHAYDRAWARTVVDDARARLRQRYVESGKEEVYRELEHSLDGSLPEGVLILAGRLGMTPVALKSAVHRLRRRFGDEIRNVVAETLQDEGEIDGEIRWLMKTLEESHGDE